MRTAHSNIVTSAIVRKLAKLNANVPIYREQVLQEFKTPCFFVRAISQRPSNGLSEFERYVFDVEVSYFTETEDTIDYQHGNQLLFQMIEHLDEIEVEYGAFYKQTIHATSVTTNINEGKYTYVATYVIRIRKEQNPAPTIAGAVVNSQII